MDRTSATSRTRRALRRARAALRSMRAVTIRSGAAAGLRVGLRNASSDYSAGDVEQPVQDTLTSLLHDGDVFYDIGANVGFFTLLASRQVGPRGRVHAFEPRSTVVTELRVNVERNRVADRVRVWPVAVGAADTTVRLLCPDHPGGATIEPGEAVDVVYDQLVPCVTIDRLVAAGDIEPPNVVKIDVEGAEAAVLEGMLSTLGSTRPVIVYEVDDATARGAIAKHDRLSSLLEGQGYRVEQLPPSYTETAWHVVHAVARPARER